MPSSWVSWCWAVLGVAVATPAHPQLPEKRVPDTRIFLAQNTGEQTSATHIPGGQTPGGQTLGGQTPAVQTLGRQTSGGQTQAGPIPGDQTLAGSALSTQSAQVKAGTTAGHPPGTQGVASQGAGLCRAGGNGEVMHKIPARLTAAVNATFNTRMTSAQVVASTVYRCIGPQTVVCAVGANLNCGKADQSRAPGPGIVSWCRSHPDADFVPLFASGHATVYDWSCRGGIGQVGRQLRTVDGQGFVAENWKPLGDR